MGGFCKFQSYPCCGLSWLPLGFRARTFSKNVWYGISARDGSSAPRRAEPRRHVTATLSVYFASIVATLLIAVARCHQVRLNQPSIAHVSVMSTQRPDGRALWLARSVDDRRVSRHVLRRRLASPAPAWPCQALMEVKKKEFGYG